MTTKGFRDVLIIGRQKRYETYDLRLDKPVPLIARRWIYEAIERIGAEGEVVQALDEDQLQEVIDEIAQSGAQAVAISLLHAYANPAHEEAIANALRERLPDLPISVSSKLSPKFREYERTSTTVANAYVQPIVRRYLGQLRTALRERGLANDMYIMQSAGGLISTDIAADEPVRIVESGPAAGVLLSAQIGRALGEQQVITFDMGGTTAKLGAIDGGQPAVTPTFEVDPIRYRPGSGLPISVPAIELLEIGAGGGSIARTEMGMITVGPESAGANPGPICYGRGGEQSTVTDANLVLGYLNPDFFNAGEMRLTVDAATRGITRDVAEPLGLSTERAAWGIHAAANANMERAMRIVSVERGRDPRNYAIVAFGGAGPVHAARLAQAVGAPRVIVPFGAGVGSAIGMLEADPKVEASVTRVMRVSAQIGPDVARLYRDLEQRVDSDLARLGVEGKTHWQRYGYFRYAGQGYEIRAELEAGVIGDDYPEQIKNAFFRAYERQYGYCDRDAEVEAVDWHLVATVSDVFESTRAEPSEVTTAPAPNQDENRNATRSVWFPETDGFAETEVLQREALEQARKFVGPIIVEDPESTIVVPPNCEVSLTSHGHILIEIGGTPGGIL